MSDDTLRGDALQERARELEIEGRSDMTADELRDAVAKAEAQSAPAVAINAPSRPVRGDGVELPNLPSSPAPAGREFVVDVANAPSDSTAENVDKHSTFRLFVENPADRTAILEFDGVRYVLSQSDIADLRKALDHAFLEVH